MFMKFSVVVESEYTFTFIARKLSVQLTTSQVFSLHLF